ncbi:MAG TPA: chemotaxis response regulator protein-glutamate methylesterase [Pyrinomonadaceae bacterium]|nr:chemotaxis response regulator protein-glutamate methylesterase [Pyrinomonadaceae bacterium]
MNRIIRILIVDDSAYVRKVVREMLSNSPMLEVVGAARDGKEALELVQTLNPDVITSDLMMPELDGLGFVREQMSRRPIPIVMMSSVDENNADTLAALDAGAVDFVQKPTALATEKMFEVRQKLIEKIKTAAEVHLENLQFIPTKISQTVKKSSTYSFNQNIRYDVMVLGISTGGPQALRFLIPQLPADFPIPVAIVLHMPVGYTKMYAEKLNEISALEVLEAQEGDELIAGRVLLAPAGKHLTFKRNKNGQTAAHLSLTPLELQHRPAVDVLFQSAAETFRDRTLGIVMTGMGKDGQNGAAWIKAQGGTIFTEAEETCVVFGMPGAVIEAGLSDKVIGLDKMAQVLLEIV